MVFRVLRIRVWGLEQPSSATSLRLRSRVCSRQREVKRQHASTSLCFRTRRRRKENSAFPCRIDAAMLCSESILHGFLCHTQHASLVLCERAHFFCMWKARARACKQPEVGSTSSQR
eukprot:367219-Rhodomonas_salina.1